MQNPNPPYFDQPWEEVPNANLALTFGILSICTAFLCGCIPVGPALAITAILNARDDRKRYRDEPGRYTAGSYNRSMAGMVTGIIGLSFYFLSIVFFIVMVGLDLLLRR